jgi:pentatricopeptide repeat protein
MLKVILASCEDGFEPTFKVWQKLIIASSHVARTEATWEIVRKACVGMLKYLPSSFPDSRLLKIGLDAAEKTGDADLAAEFLSRMWNMQQQMDEQGVDFSASEIDTPGDADKKLEDSGMVWKVPETLRSRPMRRHVNVPPQAILKTIGLCVELGELERAQSLLNLCCSSQNQTNNSRIPDSTRRQMYNVVIAGYAQKGDFDNAHDLLTTMQKEGPKPR